MDIKMDMDMEMGTDMEMDTDMDMDMDMDMSMDRNTNMDADKDRRRQECFVSLSKQIHLMKRIETNGSFYFLCILFYSILYIRESK